MTVSGLIGRFPLCWVDPRVSFSLDVDLFILLMICLRDRNINKRYTKCEHFCGSTPFFGDSLYGDDPSDRIISLRLQNSGSATNWRRVVRRPGLRRSYRRTPRSNYPIILPNEALYHLARERLLTYCRRPTELLTKRS